MRYDATMIIRCCSNILMRAVELKQTINEQWPYIVEPFCYCCCCCCLLEYRVYSSNRNLCKFEIGFYSPLNAREKSEKTPYLTINCTMELLCTLTQRFSNFFGPRPLVHNLHSIPRPSRKSQYFATFVFV